MKNVELDKKDTTIKIKPISVNVEWKIIGIEKRWIRNCPTCNKEIFYKHSCNFYYAKKRNKSCLSCNTKGENNPSYGIRWNIDKRRRKSESVMGIHNPFYGKSHSKESKKKISEFRKSIKVSDDTKKKLSIRFSGKGNNRYGKSPPKSSGSGWHSWYNGYYFRSLRELQFYIEETERTNSIVIPVEHKISIDYKDELGNDRTYKPDFLIGRKLIEIKPKYLWNDGLIRLKREAAIKYCQENGYEYSMVDIIPNISVLKEKYLRGEIKFLEKWKERFEKYAGIK